MNRNWNSDSGAGSAVDTVVIAAIIEICYATFTDFMSSLSTLIVDDRVFYKPCLLFATGHVGPGERAEVRALGLGRSVTSCCKCVRGSASRLPSWPSHFSGKSGFGPLSIPFRADASYGYGMNRDCEQPLFEKTNEVATLANDKMYLEI